MHMITSSTPACEIYNKYKTFNAQEWASVYLLNCDLLSDAANRSDYVALYDKDL